MDKKIRLKRIIFRSVHRGTKESDMILGPFATHHLESMSDGALDEFEAFLEESDNDIWDWISGAAVPSDGRYQTLVAQLQSMNHTHVNDEQ
jgi:antitoxin CptB